MTDILKQSSAEDDFSAAFSTASALLEPSSASHWDFINSWRVEPQSNDRAPVFGVVVPLGASASARRSTLRRKRQEMFKAWSQDRHD